MLSINSYAVNSWGSTSSLAGVTAASAIEGSGKTAATGSTDSSASISNLARQLSEAAERAAVRDASMMPAQLAATGKSLRDTLLDQAGKVGANAEVPNTDDPELLARAIQATEFVNVRGGAAFVGKNPFAGLSREQLVLIMYDEGDAFTTNERRAAMYEYNHQASLWSQRVCAQGQAEMASTGTYVNFFKACIAEYQAGSPIEQASYPPNYVAARQRWIDYWESGQGSGDMARDFFEVMLRPLPTPKKYSENLSWGLTSRLSSGSPERAGY
ncbi:MAG: hypothetical protein LBE85_02425 [Candidatus Accumulibacter sp.]|jgi:hypothetical protein|nr:hypothetical protein [Accumulibacter sp.]